MKKTGNNHFQGFSDECSQTFLWIHQEKWQRDLLVKFGNTITLIDATYKTTKYEVALFFLYVKTNVGYVVVAEFVVSSESAQEIAEALSILKMWNPDWNPAFFTSDYSEAEFLAVEQVFPSSQLYICEFHREQAWERWTRDHKHGLKKEDGEKVLDLLRDCAHAPVPSADEKLPIDHYYQCALKRLKDSSLWKDNIQLKQWLSGTWLGIPQVIYCFHSILMPIVTYSYVLCIEGKNFVDFIYLWIVVKTLTLKVFIYPHKFYSASYKIPFHTF